MEKGRCLKGCLDGFFCRHPEFISGSRCYEKHRQSEMLKRVQHDVLFNNNAFTLIELLVVVLIIGILAAVAVPQYNKAVLKSRYVQLIAAIRPAFQAQQAHYLATGTYTANWDELSIELPGQISNWNVEGDTLRFGDYYCLLSSGSHGAAGVECVYTSKQNYILEYRIYVSGAETCSVSQDWKDGNAVCKSISGKDPTPASNSLNRYVISY